MLLVLKIYARPSFTDATAFNDSHFGPETTIIIALVDVACTVYEPRLIECQHDNNTAHCSHSDDAGAQCVPSELILITFDSPITGLTMSTTI